MKKRHQHNLDYYSYVSGLREWNRTWKTAFAVGAVITVIALNSLWVSVMTILYMAYLSIYCGKVHLRDYVRLFTIPFTFILLSGIAIAVQIGETQANSIRLPGNVTLFLHVFGTSLCVTKQGLHTALQVMMKALGAVSAMYMLNLSTPMGEILAVLRKMHVPAMIIELMHLIYRYIFLLTDINRRQKDAAMSRLGYHSYKASIRSFSNGLANLLVMSLKRGSECYDAMESRGYDGELVMLEEEHPLKTVQIIYLVGYVIFVGVIVAFL